MTDIYLVRHAQPITHTRRLISLFLPKTSALSEIGRMQARITAQRLRDVAATRLFSSPVPRALETAQIIGNILEIDIGKRDELKEQNRGPLISKISPHHIPNIFPEDWQSWQSGNLDYVPPRGESTRHFLLRVDNMLKEFERESRAVIVVTHFGFIQGVICRALGLPFRFSMPLDFDEASITHIRIQDGEYILMSLNDTAHWQSTLGISKQSHRVAVPRVTPFQRLMDKNMSNKNNAAISSYSVDFLLAEYAMLRDLRQDTISHGESRLNFFLATVSGALVGIPLINQVSVDKDIILFVNSTIIIGLFILGLITFGRLVQRSVRVIIYTRGLNRIRRYFVDQGLAIQKYLILSINDDHPAFEQTGDLPKAATLLDVTAPVAAINSVIASVGLVLLLKAFTILPTYWAIFIGIVIAGGVFLTQISYHATFMKKMERKTKSHFPSIN